MPNIPLQHHVTTQVLKRCQPFRDLKLTSPVSHRVEYLRFLTQESIIATAEDSVLRTEMTNLGRWVGWDNFRHTAEMGCGCKKFDIDTFGDHVSTSRVVDQLDDLFLRTHKVKTQQVARSRGQRCGPGHRVD